MHIGSFALFEGEPPTTAEWQTLVESKLHLVERFHQKVRFVPQRGPPRCGSTTRTSTWASTSAAPRCRRRATRNNSIA